MGLTTYPSNKKCPRCGMSGHVYYLEDSAKYVAKCINCGFYFGKDDYPMCVLDREHKPITNADHIRAMSDEEMAEWLVMIERRLIENALSKPFNYTDEQLKADWLNWLQQETKDE